MMLPALLAIAAMGGVQDAPIQLQRLSQPGEKLAYTVKSFLALETRGLGLDTFLPQTVDINYDFSVEATKAKADGIFEFRYKRPIMTVVEGETVDHGPVKTVEKTNYDLLLTISPINEFLDSKDLSAKDPKKAGGGLLRTLQPATASKRPQDSFMEGFIDEIQRLALFIGSIDSAIDFQPKLDFREVAKGDTWKRTVSYSPQKLKSKNDKTVMQRLDYVYTYGGVVEVGGQKVHRVTAALKMKTDLVDFIKDNFEVEGGIPYKEMSFQLQATIDYDLDFKTGHTLRGIAKSEGGFKVVSTQYPDDPLVEQRLKGTTKLTLVKKS